MAECQDLLFPSPAAFQAMLEADATALGSLPRGQLRLLLPCLVRLALCAPADQSPAWASQKKHILRLLSALEPVNAVVELLSIEFHVLEQDARKELALRRKVGSVTESVLVSQLQQGLALEFEHNEPPQRLRLVLSELLTLTAQLRDGGENNGFMRSSELFETEIYLQEVADVISILQAELPTLLQTAEVAEALLHVHHGTWFICLLVANSPDSFTQVCRGLIRGAEQQDEDGAGAQRRVEALRRLCLMRPSETLNVRSMAVEECRLPSLAVALTLDLGGEGLTKEVDTAGWTDVCTGGDLVAFVSGLLLGSSSRVRIWIGGFVRAGQQRHRGARYTVLRRMRDRLLGELASILTSEHHSHADAEILMSMEGITEETKKEGTNIGTKGSVLRDGNVVRASALLRLYCALMGIAGLRPTEDEAERLIELITSHPPATAAGVRFISLALAMLLAFSALVCMQQQEVATISWLNWMIKEEAYFESVSGVTASFGEMLLLVAMYFHSNQLHAIIDLVCSTLGMKIPIKSSSLSKMKIIFTQEIFTEQVVTAHAARVAVTPGLSATMPGFLPVHCIHQLLRSRAFTKHKVAIKDWIYQQIRESQLPLHPQLLTLLDAFITSVFTPASRTSPEQTNRPITEYAILCLFQEESSVTAQLLILYYLLSYEEALLAHTRNLARRPQPYSPNLMDQIPVKHLVSQARRLQQQVAGLYPCLLRLVAASHPDLCLVEDWLQDEPGTGATALLRCSLLPRGNARCSPQELERVFTSDLETPLPLLRLLSRLSLLPPAKLIPYAEEIAGGLGHLLARGCPQAAFHAAARLWAALNSVMPRRLWVLTVNALQAPGGPTTRRRYTERDLMLDPLLVLRCDPQVYRSPPLMGVMLRVLAGALAASKAYLVAQLRATSDPDARSTPLGVAATEGPDVTRDELRSALLAAQDSAAVQILLEICLPDKNECPQGIGHGVPSTSESHTPPAGQLGELLTERREVQGLICSFLHQMFIADPNIAKLVLFQGYPSELLSLTVAGIPSMHICLDFLPELLIQPQLQKRVFGIQLATELCQHYPLPKALSVARLVLGVIGTLLSVLPGTRRAELLVPTLPCLPGLCKAFPSLYDDALALLAQAVQVCGALQATCPDRAEPTTRPHPVASVNGHHRATDVENERGMDDLTDGCTQKVVDRAVAQLEGPLSELLRNTFSQLVATAVIDGDTG
uniref:integrator complex subunit 2 isoform X1 n=1 Tax=Myxine glutinosa TaxID=7769 RepID=UPI00358EB64C